LDAQAAANQKLAREGRTDAAAKPDMGGSSSEPSSADKAAHACKARDDFLQVARKGIKDLADFTGDVSMCANGDSDDACEKARESQKEALQKLRRMAKEATQNSKKAGREACKFARAAGASEHAAERERDEAEREAERLEEQAERQAEKEQNHVEQVFRAARVQAQKAARKAMEDAKERHVSATAKIAGKSMIDVKQASKAVQANATKALAGHIPHTIDLKAFAFALSTFGGLFAILLGISLARRSRGAMEQPFLAPEGDDPNYAPTSMFHV
jgi:hypothetical protein